jgi:hypothetical protein
MRADLDNGIAQLAGALDPDSCKVDGREHRDRLAFSADFARLILYYDQSNTVDGNWQPFFLKDPAILLAAISKADPDSYYTTFLTATAVRKPLNEHYDALDVALINELCTLLHNMFVLLDLWFRFLRQDQSCDVLYKYLSGEIAGTLSKQLWRTLSLQQGLSIAQPKKIAPPDWRAYNHFDPLWRTWAGDATETELGDIHPARGQSALQQIHGSVYEVFTRVVDYARKAFDEREGAPTPYPDTALLIVFSRLMELQQAGINQIGRKHLDFYFQRVLQLGFKPAQADQVYACLQLSAKVGAFSLPAGTPFKAGAYADGSDILYVSDETVDLNRASVAQVRTLYYSKAAQGGGLYLGTVAGPDQVSGGAGRAPRSWDAFGNRGGTPVSQGFALASPLLLLQGGTRTITVTMRFADPASVSTQVLDGAAYFLSTAKAWLTVAPVAGSPSVVDGAPQPQLRLQFKLDSTTAPITAFTQGADGYASVWPMLKVVLGPSVDLSSPPALSGVTIAVHVDDYGLMTMANDMAPLPSAGAVQLYGPVPEPGSSFYAGSGECFAKPLTALTLTLTWDALPSDLSGYYAAYNTWLLAQTPTPPPPFNNSCFTVDTALLSNKAWLPLRATPGQTGDAPVTAPAAGSVPLFQPLGGANQSTTVLCFGFASPVAYAGVPELALSALPAVGQASDGYLRLRLSGPAMGFGHDMYAQLVASISLQNAQTLIKMANPPKKPCAAAGIVKAAKGTAMAAAGKLKQLFQRAATVPPAALTSKPKPQILDMPNPPYSPKLLSLSTSYDASKDIEFASPPAAADYPFELYHYGSFGPYLACDAQSPSHAPGWRQLTPRLPANPPAAPCLPLFPGVAGAGGGLYLALAGVDTPCSLTWYLDIVPGDNTAAPGDGEAAYFYWSAQGWQALRVLLDETANLSRSGMLRLALPALSPVAQTDSGPSYAAPAGMAGGDFWIAVTPPPAAAGVRFSYVNTQAVKLRRAGVAALAPGATPQIDAGTIVTTLQKLPQIRAVTQPVASFGGLPAEDGDSYDRANSFYRRVSMRLNHKDRAVSRDDYIELAHEACANLYYAEVLAPAPGAAAGQIVLGLVNGYADTAQANAFRPWVSAGDQLVITQYLAGRASAVAGIAVQNLRHQQVKITVEVLAAPQTNGQLLAQQLDRLLQLYLSPWIAGDAPQMSIGQGLSRSALIAAISRQVGVLAVTKLKLSTGPADGDPQPTGDDPLVPDAGAVLVSASRHEVTIAGSRHG